MIKRGSSSPSPAPESPESPDPSTSPILICGCPGSGTSLVTRMLRHVGLFSGIDSGPMDARKYHESQCFQVYNRKFLQATIDFSHAPKSAAQFENHNLRMRKRISELAEMVSHDQLMSDFWGPEGPQSCRPWGWKDPRNSATAMIWHRVFPELRLIVVKRRWKWRERWIKGGSQSGRWFRSQSTRRLRKMYTNPVGVEACPARRVDVDQLTCNADYFADVCRWCGLDGAAADRFEEFLVEVEFEN